MIKKTLKINGVERILILDKDERKSHKILYLQDEPCSRSCRDHNH